MTAGIPREGGRVACTLEYFDDELAGRHLLHGVMDHWARLRPDEPALIDAPSGTTLSWATLANRTRQLARRLLALGLKQGDVVATQLPFLIEHVLLEYACFRIGALFVPLDLRLKPTELARCLELVSPRAFVFPGPGDRADFSAQAAAARAACPTLEFLVQAGNPAPLAESAMPARDFLDGAELATEAERKAAEEQIAEEDGCLVIFTTGSTGSPKPALLSHRNISCQNMCLGASFGLSEDSRMLVNLPASHVGSQTEQLMTTWFWGGVVVLLPLFEPRASLLAIERHRVDCLGQIPALYEMEWRLPDYDSHDLSSLRFALHGGQLVTGPFLERLKAMAPLTGTGLGLTETAGFCTYSSLQGEEHHVTDGLGHPMPVQPMSIREAMSSDGSSGAALPAGELGEVCFEGPQNFLGYLGDEAATRKTLSTDGVLYTGDCGFVDEQGLHLKGRRRFILKPKGHQVFPAQVEDVLARAPVPLGRVAVVGAPHAVFSDGLVAFLEARDDRELDLDLMEAHCKKELASYMRPAHWVVLSPATMPLNRAAKTDYVELEARALAETARLRSTGGWDA